MDAAKKKLMLALMVIALVQMPQLALSPGINLIKNTFQGQDLVTVQTALALSSLVAPVTSAIGAVVIGRGLATKRGFLMTGLLLLSVTGVLAICFHGEFWNVILLSAALGISTGCFLPQAFGLLFDNFEAHERSRITGLQSSFINIGGILMSLFGGLLATAMWYGGYLMLLIGAPVAALAFFTVPKYRTPKREKGTARKKINPRIFYYAGVVFFFMMVYNVCGANISTHISALGDSAVSGIAVSLQMGGGVASGLLFSKISKRLGDYALTAAFAVLFAGYMVIGLFPGSLALIMLGVFITGLSLSIALPQCMFQVSTLTDASGSASATALVSNITPGIGAFLSSIVFTGITERLFGQATAPRYLFVACTALLLGAAAALVTARRGKKAG